MPRLANIMAAHGEALHSRFLIGEETRVSLAQCCAVQPEAAKFIGASIVLAVPDQLRGALALVALDGIARRVVLMPLSEAGHHRAAVCRAADADLVIEDWVLPACDAQPASAPAACLAGDTEWVLLTSGTSGVPKLVVHTLDTLAGHLIGQPAPASRIWGTFYDTRRYGGLSVLLRALIQNETLVLPCPHLAMRSFLAHAAAQGVTHVVGTPSHYRQMLISGAAAALSPHYVRLSGEIADQTILDRLRAQYPDARIVHAFASTEAGLAFEVEDGEAGLPADLTAVAVQDVAAEIDETGLRVRSPRNALGYLDGTRKPLHMSDGFVETGDQLAFDGSRYRFAGRRSGEVNVGGQKVHPEEVEAILYEHAAVDLCAVWARANAIMGAVVAADIVSRVPPSRAVANEILAYCRTRLPSHKVPVSICFVPQLQINRSGKLDRRHA